MARSITPTLEEVETETAATGRKIYEGAGITADDLSFENMYDGFAQFHQFHIEGLRYRGMQPGDALDFYQTDISIEGPNPILSSGGNIGSGRSRFWMHTDCMQQIQGRAGRAGIDRGEAGSCRFGRAHAFWLEFHGMECYTGLACTVHRGHIVALGDLTGSPNFRV